MTEGSVVSSEAAPHAAGPGAESAARRPWFFLVTQVCALLSAAYLGWHSYRMVDHDRLDIDRALLWMAAALVMLAYFAWDGSLPRIWAVPRAVAGYVRAHPAELAVLAGICVIGVFVRLFRYGDLPPNGYIYFEEHINGGIGWDILHGDRPYAYPLERYASALGQWLIGPSTTGLRGPQIAAGILTIIPFYLLMREMVDRPAALFATGLFASLRVIGDTSSYYQVGELVAITTVWMFVRGLRTGNAIWFVAVGVGAAELLYEYETFKAVPLLCAPFAGFFWLREVLLPLPQGVAPLWQRVRGVAPKVVRAVVVTAVVVAIGVGPMVAQAHRHQNIFFSSLDRQEGDRSNRGTPGLLSPDAAEQLKWSVQVFTPLVKPDFTVLGPVPARGAIDKITSLLLWVSVIAAFATFWRGARALFLSWFVGGVLGASLLLANFSAWKVVGFLPPAVVLTGFLADDVLAFARRHGQRAIWQATAAFAAIIAGVLYLNVRTLNANANDPLVVREWSNLPSQLYSICDHLRDRPSDNYAYVSERVRDGWGFAKAPGDQQERIAAWSDWRFICWGLRGEAIANLQEAWPLYTDRDGPVSLISVIGKDEVPDTIAALPQAIPDLGGPDRFTTAPGGLFSTLSFATTGAQLNARRGLLYGPVRTDGTGAGASIVPGPAFVLPHIAGAGAFTLSGLVYAPSAMDASLVPSVAAGTPPMAITVDGAASYDSAGAPGVETPQRLLQGWHLVRVRANATGDVSLRLHWHARDGATVDPGPDDFYGVEDPGAWRHTRTFDGTTTGESVRFDFFPHVTYFEGLRIDARHVLPPGTRITEDRWKARWTVDAADLYLIKVAAPGQTARLTIDGKEVAAFAPPHPDALASVQLAAGDHDIELVFSASPNKYIGGLMSVADSQARTVTMRVHPF
jgi:hypothetical protein